MSRIFIDGWESGDNNCWTTIVGGAVVSGAVKYSGNYSCYLNNGARVEKDIVSASTYYFAFKYRQEDIFVRDIFGVLEGITNHVRLQGVPTNGALAFEAYNEQGDTLLATSSHTFNANTWRLLELYIYINDASGRFVLKVDGATEIDFTGDTRNGGVGEINRVVLGYTGTTGSLNNGYFDDFVIDDAGWIGETSVYGLSPSGAGNSANWTPSAGNNWECVDEVPYSDSDYIYTNSNDVVDTYALTNMSVSPYSIKCVQAMARAQKEGASTPQNLALVLRQGGTDYPGSDQQILTSFSGHTEMWENDPNTSSAWLEAGVNSLEAGVKSRA